MEVVNCRVKLFHICMCECVCVCMYVCVCVLNCFSCVWLFVTLWTVALQTPLFMGFFRQEYWSGLPFPPPKDLPDPGIELVSPALASGFFFFFSPLSHLGSPSITSLTLKKMWFFILTLSFTIWLSWLEGRFLAVSDSIISSKLALG